MGDDYEIGVNVTDLIEEFDLEGIDFQLVGEKCPVCGRAIRKEECELDADACPRTFEDRSPRGWLWRRSWVV